MAFDEVQAAEDLANCQFATEVLNVGKGVPVRGGDVVEAPVITPGAPGTV